MMQGMVQMIMLMQMMMQTTGDGGVHNIKFNSFSSCRIVSKLWTIIFKKTFTNQGCE
jgi:hypothetical protein